MYLPSRGERLSAATIWKQGTTVLIVISGTSGGYIKVAALNACGTGSLVQKNVAIASCKTSDDELPDDNGNYFSRFDFYPNPANTEVNFDFSFAESGMAELKLFDINGELVAEVLNRNVERGTYQKYILNTSEISNGIYLVQFKLNSSILNRKLVIAK